MTALAAAANRQQRGEARLFRVPVNAASVIHKGAIVALDTTGNAVPGADTAAFVVVGIARESVTGGTNDGDEWVTLEA